MTSSEHESEREAELEVVLDLAEDVKEAERRGLKLLVGDARVSVDVVVDDAHTPQAAVEAVIHALIHYGTDVLTWTVLDKGSGESVFVRRGQVYDDLESLDEDVEDGRA